MRTNKHITNSFSGGGRLGFMLLMVLMFAGATNSNAQREGERDSVKNGLGIVRRMKDTVPRPDTLIYSWRYARNSFVKLYAEFDTTLLSIQLPEDYKRKWSGFTYLGNVGTAVKNSSFFEQREVNTHWRIRYFYPYLRTHEKHIFYNTKSPFTQLHYVSAGQNWQYFTFEHTQNVNNNVNLGLSYEIYNSEGYVIFQNTKNRNFSLWTDVNYNRYKAQGSLNFNEINVLENGGIRSDYLLSDTSARLQEINIKLTDASNEYRYLNVALDHQLKLFPFRKDSVKTKGIWLSHHFSFDKMQHLYEDVNDVYQDPVTQESFNFYDNTFNGGRSNDTISFIDYKNRFSLSYQAGKNNNIYFGPFLEQHQIKVTNLYRDTLFTYNNDTTYRTLSVGGQFTYKKPEGYTIDIQGYYHPFTDYEQENHYFSTNLVRYQPIGFDTLYMHFQFTHEERKADYLYRQYYSNHFKWRNNFRDEQEQKLFFNLRLIKSRLNIEVTANLLDNFIYFDENMEPKQHINNILVVGGKIAKQFTWWNHFNLEVNLLGQYSATDIIDIPELTAKGTFYYHRLINVKSTGGKFTLYAGVTTWMYTKYYAPAYAPATAQFYLQRDRLIGNYPLIDIFVGGRIKRFLLFARMEHANSGMRGTSYYSAYEYPMRPRNLRFGVSWNFYN
ncbi:MAG: hypothetical protein PF489_00660 [Salinivirgaceae bacterium]|nr:hypothetical protein [Salinivirgaceae bacterium]